MKNHYRQLVLAVAVALTGCSATDMFTTPVENAGQNRLETALSEVVSTPEIQSKLTELYQSDTEDQIRKLSLSQEKVGPYTLHKGDILEISIQDHVEMTRNVRVINDGTLTYLFIGTIPALGRTLEEIRKTVKLGLKTELKNVEVSVLPIQTYEKRDIITVLGAVKNPGRFDMKNEDVHLLDFIADAGGLLFARNDITGGEYVANLRKSYHATVRSLIMLTLTDLSGSATHQ